MTRTLIIAAALAGIVLPLEAQEAPRADRVGQVLAVVGDSAILNFDVQEGIYARAAAMRQPVPAPGPEYDALAQDVLQDLIDEMVVLQAALRDTTLIVPEDQLTRAVQRQIEQDQQQLGGPVALERELRASGRTLADYRSRLLTTYRKRELIRLYQQKMMRERRPPRVSEQELREAWEVQRERLPLRDASISFNQIVVRTQPSEAAMARARQRADSVMRMVLGGEDFALLARRFTDDVATREAGGDLGFIRRADYVRDFANVAFSLREGQVSPPVRTQFGWHIIKVERIRGAEIQARHILFRPELEQADAFRARARADTVVERLRAGTDLAEIQRQYGDADTPLRGGPMAIDTLQRMLGIELTNVQPGEIVGPVPLGGEEVATEFLIMRVLEREPAREWRLDDPQMSWVREQVAQQKLMEEILAELRRSTYIEIRRG